MNFKIKNIDNTMIISNIGLPAVLKKLLSFVYA